MCGHVRVLCVCDRVMRKRQYCPLDPNLWGGGDVANVDGNVILPTVHNIVSTSTVESSSGYIDLQRVSKLLPNSRYDRKRFAAVTLRIAEPNCTGLLFSSGKLVVTGSVSRYACILASHTISALLRDADPSQDYRITSCNVQNMVAHAVIGDGYYIDVDSFYIAYNEFSTYQKNVFPGLVFRPPDSPVVLLIFGSGKVVCTGGKSCSDIEMGFLRLFPLIKSYIRKGKVEDAGEALLGGRDGGVVFGGDDGDDCVEAAAAEENVVRELEQLEFVASLGGMAGVGEELAV